MVLRLALSLPCALQRLQARRDVRLGGPRPRVYTLTKTPAVHLRATRCEFLRATSASDRARHRHSQITLEIFGQMDGCWNDFTKKRFTTRSPEFCALPLPGDDATRQIPRNKSVARARLLSHPRHPKLQALGEVWAARRGRYFSVISGGVIIRQRGINLSIGKYAEGTRVGHRQKEITQVDCVQ